MRRFLPYSCAIFLAACAQQPSNVQQANAADPQTIANSGKPSVSLVRRESSRTNDRRRVHAKPAIATDGNTVKDERQSDTASVMRGCYLKVDRVVRVKGRCLVFPMGKDEYTLNTWDHGKPAHSHFAMVSANPDGTATASWNADPDDDRAMDPLGIVIRQGNCWINERTRICVR